MTMLPALAITVPAEGPCHIAFRGTAGMARLLIGRPADQAPMLVGSLYAICAHAQSAAARLAVTGELPDADRAAVAGEVLREHALRILLDWPRSIGDAPEVEQATRINTLSRDAGGHDEAVRLVQAAVFGEDAREWLARSPQELIDWAFQCATTAMRFIAEMMGDDCWVPAPAPFPLAERNADHPLVALSTSGMLLQCHLARLVDLARLCTGERAPMADAPAPGIGIVACSRGVLRHEVSVQDGMITDYRITSPTERQFGASGMARRWLDALPPMDGDKRLSAAARIVQALDPCVEYRCSAHKVEAS